MLRLRKVFCDGVPWWFHDSLLLIVTPRYLTVLCRCLPVQLCKTLLTPSKSTRLMSAGMSTMNWRLVLNSQCTPNCTASTSFTGPRLGCLEHNYLRLTQFQSDSQSQAHLLDFYFIKINAYIYLINLWFTHVIYICCLVERSYGYSY